MWRAIKYTWAVLRALITLAITLECLLIADSKVFTVLVALLILIYLQNVGAANILGRVMYSDVAQMSRHLREIRAKLDIRDTADNEEDHEETVSASERIVAQLREYAVQEFVFLIQTSIMYALVVFFLLKTVFL